ncbi:hypothetical protein HDE78_001568 [Rhodanobacter sp. K2T2]|uniref:hypothetical protein n=1 Tax=Rhodanobacter sp. K2T2 TaxID=2723085 RepID=UPI0015CA536F|nr:hypothetical protein [Rhodanobacter sp. K2T2]NYE28612.1 hypothetical protein [Rhodanobacter sp. K2T2]
MVGFLRTLVNYGDGEHRWRFALCVMNAVDAKNLETHITPWRGARSPIRRAALSVSNPTFMGEIVMYNYPVLECLVAFAIVFSIGYLVADSNSREEAVAPKSEVART